MPRNRLARVGVAVVAAFVAVTCVALGLWQLRRLDDRRARNAAIERERSRDPHLITSGAGKGGPPPSYTPIRASGRFDPEHEVLVYGRSLNGRPGHWVATPFLFDDGSAALVVRGWVPFDHESAPVLDARPPAGEFTIEGFLLPDEGDGSATPNADGVVRRLDADIVGRTLQTAIYPRPIMLTAQAEPQPDALPLRIGWPELSEGPHLSYAIQWFSFATIAVVGGVILYRRRSPASTGGP